MLTKQDFLRSMESDLDQYPTVALRYKVGDPHATRALNAIAQWCAMLSQQIDLNSMEIFEKARDTTVLADAALKGILPNAIPCEVSIEAYNTNTDQAVYIEAGRSLLDAVGRHYEVLADVFIGAGATSTIRAIQRTIRTYRHTVVDSSSFYEILIPEPDSDQYIAGVHVVDSEGSAFAYHPDFTNVANGDRVYHIKVDAYRRLFVQFGYGGVVGYQPKTNEVIELQITDTYGDITPKLNSPFTFEYAQTVYESRVKLTMQALDVRGSLPPSVAELRELTSYPSIYNKNAVFHGEFDRLIRESIECDFLSVWNEQVEEEVRGPTVDNINRMFVALSPNTTALQNEVKRIVQYADDSYKFKFYTPIESLIAIRVMGSVARVYKTEIVAGQIKKLLLDTYGKGSSLSKRGMALPTLEEVRQLLKKQVQALQDAKADFDVLISYQQPVLPEHWHYVSLESVSADIQESNTTLNRWGR